jgi:hypothetical protein
MADWIDRLAHAPNGLLAFCAAMMFVALFLGFSGLRRTRLIEDVPTARIRSAPQGYVELIGSAKMLDGEPVVAPLSRVTCCWYSFRVERRSGKDWRSVDSGTSDAIFVLRDDSGDCVIDPEGAEVSSRHSRSWFDNGDGWGGHGVHMRLPSLGKTADTVVNISEKLFSGFGGGGEYRYTEAVILDGDPLYAIGRFHTLGAADHGGSLRELTGAILREWKQSPETLRERFDTNRDGLIDGGEWERARAVAAREAGRQYAQISKREQVHTLSKPTDGRHFLLSNMAEFDLLRRFRWRMRLGFAGFALLGSAVALMLSTRL